MPTSSFAIVDIRGHRIQGSAHGSVYVVDAIQGECASALFGIVQIVKSLEVADHNLS